MKRFILYLSKMMEEEQYNELCFYTLSHHNKPYFIHQHVVDAYTAQRATATTKPIALIFSLSGLYLYIEKGYSGRQVQEAHIIMAKNKRQWPEIKLPLERGEITVREAILANAGLQRDRMIYEWCKSVWTAYQEERNKIRQLIGYYFPYAPGGPSQIF